MNQEKNSRPDALNSANEGTPSRQAAPVQPESADKTVRGPGRSRRSTSAPTRLKQAAELLHTAPAAVSTAAAPDTAAQAKEAPGASPSGGTLNRSEKREGRQIRPAGTGAGILPRTAAEDDPRVWGDTPEDTSAWLREQRPPHWG
ncbi:MAG: hypothetical protein ABTA24_11070 [Arthrobacter sp.]